MKLLGKYLEGRRRVGKGGRGKSPPLGPEEGPKGGKDKEKKGKIGAKEEKARKKSEKREKYIQNS